MILGGVHGVVESLFRRFTRQGMRSAAPAGAGQSGICWAPPQWVAQWAGAFYKLCSRVCLPVHRSGSLQWASGASSISSLAVLHPLLAFFLPAPSLSVLSPCSDEEAFKQSVESITGPITRIISRDGMLGVYAQFNDAGGSRKADWLTGWLAGGGLGCDDVVWSCAAVL